MTNWQRHAACGDMPGQFDAGQDAETTAAAIETCASCPVRLSCHLAARTDLTLVGVWGGAVFGARR
jgi:hypothetical protein